MDDEKLKLIAEALMKIAETIRQALAPILEKIVAVVRDYRRFARKNFTPIRVAWRNHLWRKCRWHYG